MKKIVTAVLVVGLLASTSPVFAQTNASSTLDLIAKLKAQINALKVQIETLQTAQQNVQEAREDVVDILVELRRQVRQGSSGDDVEIIQQLLALDPSIYPEGLVTRNFGKKTAKAIKKFQKKYGLTETGHVGPETLRRLNMLLENEQDPHVRNLIKKICKRAPQLLNPSLNIDCRDYIKKPGDRTATSTPDTMAPVISKIMAARSTASTTRIKWHTDEFTRGRVWYATTTPVMIRPFVPKVNAGALAKNHDVKLIGLTASTTYYYFIVARDFWGNTATSSIESFKTATSTSD